MVRGVGNSWDKHHLAFAEYIHKFTPSSVFEIGASWNTCKEIYGFW